MSRPSIASALETWFKTAARAMPWRKRPTPYGCWLSEIMLQQTTYATALPYYTRFIKAFPTVGRLAAAREEDVLKAWEGLGYYARARNLHKAAKILAATRPIAWPKSAEAWARLPGVGPYTAAALSSVLSKERVPVVDGNVARVFSRVWRLNDDFHQAPARERLAARLKPEIAHAEDPGNFNQAMMELGALVCTPTAPNCDACPLAAHCAAFKAHEIEAYPAKPRARERPTRARTVVLARDEKGRVLLVKNEEGSLLKGLWDLPTVEEAGIATQVFSHFRLRQTVLRASLRRLSFCDPSRVPLTKAAREALRFDTM